MEGVMADGVKVHVDGLREIRDALHNELPRATAKAVLRRVGMRRLEPVAKTARSIVPVEKGWLQESIDVSTRLSRRQRRLHRKPHRDEVETFAGPGPDPAAHLQEFGSDHHPPQPFMRPAWDQNKDGLLRGIEDDLWAEIQAAARRIQRKAARLLRKK